MCYCFFSALPQSTEYFFNRWIFGFKSCKAVYFVGNILGCAEAMALITIATSRSLEISKNKWWIQISHNISIRCLFIIGTWLWGLLAFSIEIDFDYMSNIGWNCEVGLCGHMPWHLSSPFYPINLIFTSTGIIVAYLIIWNQIRKSTNRVTQIGITNINFEDRDRKLTRMIFILLCSFGVAYLPMVISYVFELPADFLYISTVIFNLPFLTNVIIYQLTNPQYRKALVYYCKYIISYIKRK